MQVLFFSDFSLIRFCLIPFGSAPVVLPAELITAHRYPEVAGKCPEPLPTPTPPPPPLRAMVPRGLPVSPLLVPSASVFLWCLPWVELKPPQACQLQESSLAVSFPSTVIVHPLPHLEKPICSFIPPAFLLPPHLFT